MNTNSKFNLGGWRSLATISLSVLAIGGASFAHNGERHVKKEAHAESETLEKAAFETINDEYVKSVKPIFQNSCMNCHGATVSLPWYNSIPGVKQLIAYDTTESKVHRDMAKDFPFGGHGTPLEDLDAIQEALTKGSMPPFRYRMMHWSSSVSTEDLKNVMAWIQNSKQELAKIKIKKEGNDL